MKLLLFCGVFFFGVLYADVNSDQLKKATNETFFVSLMRTGTNWTLASLQALTHRYVVFAQSYPARVDYRENFNRLKLSLDQSKPPIYRTHGTNILKKVNGAENKLFIIIRDYRETVLRHLKTNGKKELELTKDYGYLLENYVKMLTFFETWPEENRYFFYYEDLMENPRDTLEGLLHFLEESDEHLASFMLNHDVYKNKVADSYHAMWEFIGGSISRGTDIHYHTNKAPVNFVKRIDKAFEKRVPQELWSRYLKRYSR